MKKQESLKLRGEIDNLIRSRDLKQAKSLIQSVSIKDIEPDERFHFASLARRLQLVNLSLKFLWQNVSENHICHQQDLKEYANSLRKAGLYSEALRVLSRCPKSGEFLLVEAFCYMSQWNYRKAHDILETISLQELGEPEQWVWKVNKAACLVEIGQADQAKEIIDGLFTAGIKSINYNLYLNCLELLGQVYFRKKEFLKAQGILRLALDNIKAKTDHTYLFVEMWLLTTEMALGHLRTCDSRLAIFKNKARLLGHWETLRHLDFNIASLTQDEALFNKVYFGTPHEAFKRKVLESGFNLRSNYVWQDGRRKFEEIKITDMFQPGFNQIAFGLTVHRLWMLMSSDFYRPWSSTRIFDTLFPNENYNPFTSKKRVQQLVKKLREALCESGIEFEMKSTKKGYRLRPLHLDAYKIYDKMVFTDQEEFVLHILKTQTCQSSFKKADLQAVIPLSQDQWYRLLKKLESQQAIETTGEGKGKVYHLKAS